MRASLRSLLLGALVALLAAAAAARADERSAVLVARAEVAYDAGRWDDARALFAEAVAADPDDAAARYGLGLALGKLDRWAEAQAAFADALRLRPDFADAARARDIAASHQAGAATAVETDEAEAAAETTGKPWGLRAGVGTQYDSNVELDPNDPQATGAMVFTAGAFWEPLRRENLLVRLDWDLYETVQFELSDMNFGWNSLYGTASWAPHPAVWIGTQAGYDNYTLGGEWYMQEPWVKPFVNVLEGNTGLTYAAYRFGWQDWLSDPFDPDRTGPVNAVALTQVFFLGDPSRWLSIGWQWDDELPTRSTGDDWRRNSNQALVGLGLPAWWRVFAELTMLYRADDYTEPNSYSPTGVERHDDHYEVIATLRRPITDQLQAVVRYDGIWNPSNIGLFDYRRQVVGIGLEVAF